MARHVFVLTPISWHQSDCFGLGYVVCSACILRGYCNNCGSLSLCCMSCVTVCGSDLAPSQPFIRIAMRRGFLIQPPHPRRSSAVLGV